MELQGLTDVEFTWTKKDKGIPLCDIPYLSEEVQDPVKIENLFRTGLQW